MSTPNFSFILVRGLVREHAHWGEFLPELQKRFPQARIEGLDLPGAGKLLGHTTPLSIEGMVEVMRAEFEKLQLPADVPKVLVAVSLGGMVATRWLELYPDDFQRVILINTSYANFNPPWERLRPTALAGFLPLIAKRGIAHERQILNVVSNRCEIHPRVAKEWAKIHQARPVSPLNAARQLWAAFRFKEAKKPMVPTLIMSAAKDRMVNPRCSQLIAQAWDAPMVVHPTAGHDLTTDEPAWAADEMKNWLSY